MNKQLLTALIAATFSGMTFTAEAPDYTFLPQELHEYCTANNTQACLDAAAMMKTVLLAMQKREAVEQPTQEEKEQLEPLKIALQEEFSQFNARKMNLLESADQKTKEAAQDLAKELNPTDSTDSKE